MAMPVSPGPMLDGDWSEFYTLFSVLGFKKEGGGGFRVSGQLVPKSSCTHFGSTRTGALVNSSLPKSY